MSGGDSEIGSGKVDHRGDYTKGTIETLARELYEAAIPAGAPWGTLDFRERLVYIDRARSVVVPPPLSEDHQAILDWYRSRPRCRCGC